MNLTIRLAELADLQQIGVLMKRSMTVLGVGHYSEEQIESCRQFVCVPDRQLIEDKTLFIDPCYSGKGIGSLILNRSEKAAKAHGFSKSTLGSTLSGLSFYKAKEWKKTSEEEEALLPDGTAIKVIQMEKDFCRASCR